MEKKTARLRRARRARAKIRELRVHRLSVYRSPKHIYAQVLGPDGSTTVAAASTVEEVVRKDAGYGGNRSAAATVGKLIAERAKAAGIERVAFDRSGFKYHGRVRALAESAREHGLKF